MRIYTQPNTRVLASEWIYENVPADKTLAVEHWDDQLPIGRPVNYNIETLKLYESDSVEKWQIIESQLQKTDYIILASNRLHAPLRRLTNCDALPERSCYERTADYYNGLFSGTIGFKKAAEFSNYPTIPIFNKVINDQSADESFTVYDHPEVIIFQKIAR
jgi:hypothetical protein